MVQETQAGGVMTDCPACGCNATLLVGRTRWWGDIVEKRQCEHCGKRFTCSPDQDDPAVEAVVYVRVQCPECSGDDCPVTSTQRPVRHHRCRDCGCRFKSIEG